MEPVADGLTDQEWAVLRLLKRQRTSPEIAATLEVPVDTARALVRTTLRKSLPRQGRGDRLEGTTGKERRS